MEYLKPFDVNTFNTQFNNILCECKITDDINVKPIVIIDEKISVIVYCPIEIGIYKRTKLFSLLKKIEGINVIDGNVLDNTNSRTLHKMINFHYHYGQEAQVPKSLHPTFSNDIDYINSLNKAIESDHILTLHTPYKDDKTKWSELPNRMKNIQDNVIPAISKIGKSKHLSLLAMAFRNNESPFEAMRSRPKFIDEIPALIHEPFQESEDFEIFLSKEKNNKSKVYKTLVRFALTDRKALEREFNKILSNTSTKVKATRDIITFVYYNTK